jgi:hypothetical protein
MKHTRATVRQTTGQIKRQRGNKGEKVKQLYTSYIGGCGAIVSNRDDKR